MTRIKYRGPASSASWRIRAVEYEFEKDVSVEVPERVAEYLLALNPEGHDLEKALIYGTPIFERCDDVRGGDE